MLSLMKQHLAHMPVPPRKSAAARQLQRDRWTAAIVVVVLLVFFALVAWLASLGGSVDPNSADYWPLMP